MSQQHQFGCGCDCGCDRRDFLAAMSAAAGGLMWTSLGSGNELAAPPAAAKQNAAVLGVLVGPAGADGGPCAAALRESARKLGVGLKFEEQLVTSMDEAEALAGRIQASRPDGLVIVLLKKDSQPQADLVLAAAEKLRAPMVPVMLLLADPDVPADAYRRPGLYVLRSPEELADVEFGLRMINTGKLLRQCTVLGFDNRAASETTVPFFGVRLRIVPFDRYAEEFAAVPIDDAARQLIAQFTGGAKEQRDITEQSLENAARAHFALKKILAEEQADGLTMNCLRRGWLKPCMSFATLNSQLIPAACEMDVPALCTMLVGRWLFGRPGFMHNMAVETEANHYYASHCTCATKLYGPEESELPYLLRRFAHTNEGSCAIQVFWNEGDPTTLVRVYPGGPARMDVYAGRVVASHSMPPVGGCTTNVEVELLDREDAMMAVGHHNVLFCGDFAKQFRQFAQLFRIELMASQPPSPAPAVAAVTAEKRDVPAIRTVFFYPPSKTYAEAPDGWWSWPGNDFDAEGRQQKYMTELSDMGKQLGMKIVMDEHSAWTAEHADALAKQLEAERPDGLLIVLFANHSRAMADRLLAAAERLGIPVVFYIGLGVCHGPGTSFRGYRRPGVHFIMSLENMEAIEEGLRMVKEGKPLGQGPWPSPAS
jgi:hypothetical protein